MVLFIIDRTSNSTIDYDKISKQMINIENNLCVYNKDGIMNSVPFRKNNVYKFKDVNYDLASNVGVLLFYTPDPNTASINNTQCSSRMYDNKLIIYNLTNYLMEIDPIVCDQLNLNEIYMPFNIFNFHSTNHTIVQNKLSNNTNRKKFMTRAFTDNIFYLKNLLKKNRFIWLVKVINFHNNTRYNINKFIKIAEYELSLPKMYLLQSINAIIVDKVNLFNVDDGLRQINYPSIKQYTCYKKNIHDIRIIISNTYDIDYEIASLYMSNITTEIRSRYTKYPTITMDDLNTVEIRRPNINLDWDVQLKENFNYAEQEKLEMNILNNGKDAFNSSICFVSRMPLYANVLLVTVGIKTKKNTEFSNVDNDVKESILHNTSNILVSCFIFHTLYKYDNVNISFIEYLFKLTGYIVIQTKLVKYNVSKFYALKSINNKSNSQVLPKFINDDNFQKRKEILMSICKYGMYEYNNNITYYTSVRLCITINLENKSIYVGLNELYAYDIMKLMNTDVIVYNLIII
jgi:hypothetical protein